MKYSSGVRSYFRSPGAIALYALWAVAVGVLLLCDRSAAYSALGIGGFVALIVVLGRWTLPPGDDDPPGDILRQEGSPVQLALRGLVLALTFAWVCVVGLSLTGALQPISVLVNAAMSVHLGLPRGVLSLMVVSTAVVVPMLLLFLLGARPRQLGLVWSSGGNLRLLLWLALPIAMWIWRLATGHISVLGVIAVLVENFMLNGLPEEFVFRGALLSFFRRYVTSDWAMLAMSVLFALFHYGFTFGEEHGRVVLIVANVIGENLPLGLLFGLMALRSRSIAMGTIVHFSIDATRAMYR
jgi:membrane protease YdiL (CAAX protease family)